MKQEMKMELKQRNDREFEVFGENVEKIGEVIEMDNGDGYYAITNSGVVYAPVGHENGYKTKELAADILLTLPDSNRYRPRNA